MADPAVHRAGPSKEAKPNLSSLHARGTSSNSPTTRSLGYSVHHKESTISHHDGQYFIPHHGISPHPILTIDSPESRCCWCIPLNIGCYIVGIIWLLLPTKIILKSIIIFEHWNKKEEEEEQTHYKFKIVHIYIVYFVLASLKIIVALAIIVITWRGCGNLMKVCAVLLPFFSFFTLFLQLLIDDQYSWNWFHIISQIIAIYSFVVLWSYGEALVGNQPLPLSGRI